MVQGGAEQVLAETLAVYPDAELFALIDHLSDAERREVTAGKHAHTSWLQGIPGIRTRYRSFFPVMPIAIGSLDVSGFDVVISISHAFAKGVRVRAGQLHLCISLSPVRWAWDLREQYLAETGLTSGLKGWLARALIERVRRWDLANSAGVTEFIAISGFIGERIQRAYGRSSTVIYPPVDTEYFTPAGERGTAYVTASRFVPYKRIELIVRAFAQLPDRELLVIGDGPERDAIARAAGANVRILGWQSRPQLRDHLRAARAFLFAAEEDFGIAPLDAQACGTPVIAFGKGGVAETVRGAAGTERTGVFFSEATEQGIVRAVREFEGLSPAIAAEDCRRNAERFSHERFHTALRAFVSSAVEARRVS